MGKTSLRKLAYYKATALAFVIGFLGTALLVKICRHLELEVPNAFFISLTTSPIVWLFVFFSLALHNKCPKCKNLWSFQAIKNIILETVEINARTKYIKHSKCSSCSYTTRSVKTSIF